MWLTTCSAPLFNHKHYFFWIWMTKHTNPTTINDQTDHSQGVITLKSRSSGNIRNKNIFPLFTKCHNLYLLYLTFTARKYFRLRFY